MAQIVTTKNGTTNEIQYPRTVKSALLNDDGTPLNPLTQANIVNDLTTGGVANVLSAEQGKVLGASVSQLQSSISNIDVSWDGITGKPATFAPSAHTHADYIPRSVGGEAPDISGQDLNNIIATGFYKGSSCPNSPPVTSAWVYLTVITHASTWSYQKVVDLHNPNRTWVRSKLNGVWSAWRESTVRNIIISTADPTLASMAVGDIWIKV